MEYLYEKLVAYGKSDVYPFHMPGHKREALPFINPYKIDITEIDGFDNLHHATGILKELQERAAKVFKARKTFYLINGSTCGLLAAISAATEKGDHILMARNCHKAVYHAAYLRELRVEYLYPVITKAGIQGMIAPDEVKRMLREYPDVKAVVITSPTYDGVVSDVEKIAEIVHEYGIPLIVDEAHGAHFGFSSFFPESAIKKGADVVVQSLHKTLPSFTQTALLHLQSDRVKENKIKRFLDIYETSSPSYLFMAGMDNCIRMLEEEGETLFANYESLLCEFYQQAENLQQIKLLRKKDFSKKEAFDFDASKLILSVRNKDMTGERLYQTLLHQYHLQMEMASGFYVTAITSIMDRKEGFDRLIHALLEIDPVLHKKMDQDSDFVEKMYRKNKKVLEIHEAVDKKYESVLLEKSIGKVSGEYVYLYPPGIPILVPGEEISNEIVENISNCENQNLSVEGLADHTNKRINVVNF